ncbi:hypothetical protein O6H91_15G040300 [Diphasiastrum complanatum]|uniref:Uncharacterized protein n=1 Tax=Diphasiastrum complanatum TaxID=34168 RepID=A0ACC2BHM6_DIPCM|nr:hypothetical protein O6H91_15G040300 [Diphasiastrum complanatum]
MAGKDDEEVERGRLLLSQLDRLLDADPFIDELGFVHPSELVRLKSVSDHSIAEAADVEPESKHTHSYEEKKQYAGGGEEFAYGHKEHNDLSCDDCAFWCHDHKLAIASPVLLLMYKAAKEAFIAIKKEYLIYPRQDGLSSKSEMIGRNQGYQQKLMSCTRALVLINSDHASAWNARKRILLMGLKDDLMAELRLTRLVLSCAPKSEEAWAHRRWVIGCIKGYHTVLDGVLEGDSKLIELIAERSRMNYRAWRHRCWLVSHMSLTQVSHELRRSKLWTASYVADNCCFHYRRCLLLHLLQIPSSSGDHCNEGTVNKESNCSGSSQSGVSPAMSDTVAELWKEELSWSADLIKSYLGCEFTSEVSLQTLWIHRRFLILHFLDHHCMKHCKYHWHSASEKYVGEVSIDTDRSSQQDALVESEFRFVDFCLSACEKNHPEEAKRQKEFAITYKLWILVMEHRQMLLSGSQRNEAFIQELRDVKSVLGVLCSEKQNLWEGLIPPLLGPDVVASMQA